MVIKIDKKIKEAIIEYCKYNNIDVNTYINKILNDGFMKDKYGERPNIGSSSPDVMKKIKVKVDTGETEPKPKKEEPSEVIQSEPERVEEIRQETIVKKKEGPKKRTRKLV